MRCWVFGFFKNSFSFLVFRSLVCRVIGCVAGGSALGFVTGNKFSLYLRCRIVTLKYAEFFLQFRMKCCIRSIEKTATAWGTLGGIITANHFKELCQRLGRDVSLE